MTDFLEGERGGKNVNAVAGVMIDTGARMLIKLPSEMRPMLFPPGANVRLMRKRSSLWNLRDFITTRRKVEIKIKEGEVIFPLELLILIIIRGKIRMKE